MDLEQKIRNKTAIVGIIGLGIDKGTLTSVELTEECLSEADCVVIATDHSHYDYQHIADKASLIFDTRGATKNLSNSNILRL